MKQTVSINTQSNLGKFGTRKRVSAIYADIEEFGKSVAQIAVQEPLNKDNALICITFPDRSIWSGSMAELQACLQNTLSQSLQDA